MAEVIDHSGFEFIERKHKTGFTLLYNFIVIKYLDT
jgi:hypothetical protein